MLIADEFQTPYYYLKYPGHPHDDEHPRVQLQPLPPLAVGSGSLGNTVLP